MFGKNNKKSHDDNSVLWVIFIVMATAITFFMVVEISREKPEFFSMETSGATAASKNIIAEEKREEVSVMIIPVD